MGLGYITGSSYRDNQLFQVDVSSIGEGDEASKYRTELEDSEQISLAGLVLFISREFFFSLFYPRESIDTFQTATTQPSRTTSDLVSRKLETRKKSVDIAMENFDSSILKMKETPVTQVEGGRNQFQFAGRGNHSCTLICFRFLEIVLPASVQMEAILPMMDETLEEGIIRHEEILSANPDIFDLIPNGELSPLEVDIEICYPNLIAGEGIMCKINSHEKVFFQENLEHIKGRGFQGALITGRGYTYAIVINSEAQEILLYDSHGRQKETPATIDKFESLVALSSFLAERYPYNQHNDVENDFLFLPVKAKEASSF